MRRGYRIRSVDEDGLVPLVWLGVVDGRRWKKCREKRKKRRRRRRMGKKKDSRWGPPVSIGFFFVKREKAEDNGGRSRHEMSDSGVKRKKRRRKRDSRMYFYILYRRAARQARPENKKKKKGTNPTENSKARKVFGSDGRALEHQCGKGGHDGPITARSPVLALNRNWRETDVIGHSRVSDANS